MKVGYAFRRDVFYPSRGGIAELFTGGTTDRYLAKLSPNPPKEGVGLAS